MGCDTAEQIALLYSKFSTGTEVRIRPAGDEFDNLTGEIVHVGKIYPLRKICPSQDNFDIRLFKPPLVENGSQDIFSFCWHEIELVEEL